MPYVAYTTDIRIQRMWSIWMQFKQGLFLHKFWLPKIQYQNHGNCLVLAKYQKIHFNSRMNFLSKHKKNGSLILIFKSFLVTKDLCLAICHKRPYLVRIQLKMKKLKIGKLPKIFMIVGLCKIERVFFCNLTDLYPCMIQTIILCKVIDVEFTFLHLFDHIYRNNVIISYFFYLLFFRISQ